MPQNIQLAFAHPEERAKASASEQVLDRISLRDLVLEADIGAFQPERGRQQRLRFNVVVEVKPYDGPLDDDVDRILSYDRITEAITDELATRRLNLLETLADEVAERILQSPQAQRVYLRVEKLDRGPGALGVEIMRERAAAPTIDLPDAALPRPLIVALTQAEIDSPDLSDRLSQLAALARPVVLTVAAAGLTLPTASNQAAQRRIALLAIEQNAWVLAARDARCIVVASRTELDWAMRQGRMVVWVPSKLVMDTPNGPRDRVSDQPALAQWLAAQLGGDLAELPA